MNASEIHYVPLIESIFQGRSPSRDEVKWISNGIVDGTMSDNRLSAILAALRSTPLNTDILMGAIDSIHHHVSSPNLKWPENLVDCSGTGGDAFSSVNISTMAAIVASSAGAKVGKFGSRGVTSACGSADVLEAMGIHLATNFAFAHKQITELGISFLYSASFFPQFRHISQIRKALGFHTLFDVLIPLSSPLPLFGQLIGVYSKDLQTVVGKCLLEHGRKRAMVVNSDEGLDEISVCGPTQVLYLSEGILSAQTIRPQDFGIDVSALSELKGGGVDQNAEILIETIKGGPLANKAVRNATILNAAGILWCAGIVPSIAEGIALASAALSTGKANALLNHWREWQEDAK